MNNSLNVPINLRLNKLIYEFKVKNKLTTISKKINDRFMKVSKLKKTLNKTRLRMRQKTVNAMLFVNVKAKLYHDKRYGLLLLKKENKIYFKLHKGYKIFENQNKKLSHQRCDSFFIKQRIDCLAYKLELFSK